MQLLKQSTAATVLIGPAVDKTDGFTPETSVATTPDEVSAYKSDGTAAVDISSTASLTHRAGGMYTAALSTSNTDTLGRFSVYVRKDADCRPVRADFMVVPANSYDAMILGSDNLKVDTVEWLGSAVTLSSNNRPDVNIDEISDDTAVAATLESYLDGGAVMPANMTQISGDATAADNLELYCDGGDRMPVHVQEIEPTLDFGTTMKTSLETAVANQLDTAIPGSPTANSMNERIKAIDTLIETSGAGDLSAINTAITSTGVQLDLTQALDQTPTATSVGAGIYYTMANVKHKVARVGTVVTVYQSDGTTPSYNRNLDSANNPSSLTP